MNRPENSDSNTPPPSRERKEMDPHERRLWDLEEGEDLLESDDDSVFSDVQEAASPETGETRPSDHDPLDESLGDDEELKTPTPDKAPVKEDEKRSPSPTPKEESSQEEAPADSSYSSVEKISLGVFGALILSLVIWVLLMFFGELPTTDPTITADFPVTGKGVVVKKIDTYWRKPDMEKDRGVQAATKAIPAGVLTLESHQGSCALRIFFEDDNGDLIGDPVTVSVANGQFTRAGKASIEVHGTKGFTDIGDLPTSLTSQAELWYMIVKEGPNADARRNQFKEILRLPIAAERR